MTGHCGNLRIRVCVNIVYPMNLHIGFLGASRWYGASITTVVSFNLIHTGAVMASFVTEPEINARLNLCTDTSVLAWRHNCVTARRFKQFWEKTDAKWSFWTFSAHCELCAFSLHPISGEAPNKLLWPFSFYVCRGTIRFHRTFWAFLIRPLAWFTQQSGSIM